MKKDELFQKLKDMSDEDVESIFQVIEAWERSKSGPLAYIEELMNFQSLGKDPQRGVHRYQMLITRAVKNRIGTLHGGMIATFVDTAIGATLIDEFGKELSVVTLDLSVRFLLPGREGKVIAETEVVKKGKTIFVVEAKLWDQQEKQIATASSTFYRIK